MVLWFAGVVVGLIVAVLASRRALDAAALLGRRLGLSSFLVGVTIVAIGTDLPEIANSIMASATDHGDVNVGDSVGSVVTQLTIVVGLLCFIGPIHADRRLIVTVGVMTAFCLLVGAALIADGMFSRGDAAVLLVGWVAGTFVIQRPEQHALLATHAGGATDLLVRTIGSLVVVGLGAALAIQSFTRVAELLGAPEFALSFFVLAAGTSLPELVVCASAVRRDEGSLAMGDLLGSSFVDATLSPAAGPLLFPTMLSDGIERGSIVAAGAVGLVVLLLARSPRPDRGVGVALIVLYLALYPLVLI